MSGINIAYSESGDRRTPLAAAAKVSAALLSLFDRIATWQERAQARRRLGQLDDWMLKDVGLSRADVAREMGKPFWRP